MFKRLKWKPLETFKDPKDPRTYRDANQIKYLTQDELYRLFNAARRSIRDYAILLVSYNHGMRISECAILQFEYFNEEASRLYVKRVKNGKSATYRTSDESVKALKNWIKIRGTAPGPMFLSRRIRIRNIKQEKGEILPNYSSELVIKSNNVKSAQAVGISVRGLDQLFKKYAKLAKLPEEKHHFHTLRHSVAVQMVDKDIPLVKIQDWLGHRNIQSTLIYIHVSDKARDETSDRLSNIISKSNDGAKINWKEDKKVRMKEKSIEIIKDILPTTKDIDL